MHPLIQAVQEQYNHYPFPVVSLDPAHLPPPSHYGFVHYYCFHQQIVPSQPIRILDAGCGTGNSTLKLLQANPHADIVAIELSAEALRLAQERVHAAGYDAAQLSWLQGDLMGLAEWNLEPFDYINCSGVLHHLPEPTEGLQILNAHLKPTGVMFLLLYNAQARSQIKKVQQALKDLVPEPICWPQAVETCLVLLRSLPEAHPVKQDWKSHWQSIRANLGEEAANSAAFLVDTYLTRCEHTYDLPGVYRLLDSNNLHLLRFLDESAWEPQRFMPAFQSYFRTWDFKQRCLWMDHWRTQSNYAFFCSPTHHERASLHLNWESTPQQSPVVYHESIPSGMQLYNQLGNALQLNAILAEVWQQIDGHHSWGDLAEWVASQTRFSLGDTQQGLAPHFIEWIQHYFVMV